jgi:hypothetical protein
VGAPNGDPVPTDGDTAICPRSITTGCDTNSIGREEPSIKEAFTHPSVNTHAWAACDEDNGGGEGHEVRLKLLQRIGLRIACRQCVMDQIACAAAAVVVVTGGTQGGLTGWGGSRSRAERQALQR